MFLLALLDFIERRLRDIYMSRLDQVLHVIVKQREDQRPNVRAIDIGISHENDFAVAELRQVLLLANAHAERGKDISNLLVFEHLMQAGFLHIQNFSFERKNRLEAAVAALFGGAAGGITLDQIYFAVLRIVNRAIGEFAGQRAVFERVFATDDIARFAGRLARFGRAGNFLDHSLRNRRILFQKLRELLVHNALDDSLDFGISELRFRLSFELRLWNFHRNNNRQPFAEIIARERNFA